MRWRNSYLWALGAVLILVMLGFQGRPNLSVVGPCSASAPLVPRASFESAPVSQGVLSHFDGYRYALRAAHFSLLLWAIRAVEDTQQVASAAKPVYGPLHQRPPPSFS